MKDSVHTLHAPRYRATARWVHWVTFALVALAYLFIELKGYVPKGTPLRQLLKQAHFWAGIGVLVLLVPRVWERARHAPPPVWPPLHAWPDRLAGVTHVALYAFLLVQPLLGLAVLQASDESLALPGSLQLPALFAGQDRAWGDALEEIHETIGVAFYWVIGLHIAAALWHHFMRKDDTLRRML